MEQQSPRGGQSRQLLPVVFMMMVVLSQRWREAAALSSSGTASAFINSHLCPGGILIMTDNV